MRKSRLRLYAPFIALALLQGAFVAFAPSKGEVNDPLANLATTGAGFGAGGSGVGGGVPTFDGGGDTDVAIAGNFDAGVGSTGGGTTSGTAGTGSSGAGGSTGAAGTSGTASASPSGAAAPVVTTPAASGGGDTSHCVDGKQSDVIVNAPACAPKFVGDNGGATYPGVTGEQIKLVNFACQANEQVNQILATQGLAASKEETEAMLDAAVSWMNDTYEFYGRELVWENTEGDCTVSPPDTAKNRQAASEVAKTSPAFVIHYAGNSSTHDVWAQSGIVSLGAPTSANSFFTQRRPFRWDVFPNGDETADWIAEYACKKLAKKPAANAGQIIHTSIGGRTTTRKFGILTFDNGTGETVPNAERARAAIKQCSGADVPLVLYESDINRAEEQTRAVVAKLIEEKVTTLICLCDAIAPVFLTNGLTRNNYFPEHMLSGAYLTDYDILGRLYDAAQWAHAFGPSQLAEPVEFSQSDAAKIWRAAGRSGEPCASCNLLTGYLTSVGSMIHSAGPNLNPLTIEQGLLTAQPTGGWDGSGNNPHVYLIKFGQNDYTAISDFREVYWSPTARSTIDGRNGAYVSLNGGRRYAGGQLDNTFAVPASAQ